MEERRPRDTTGKLLAITSGIVYAIFVFALLMLVCSLFSPSAQAQTIGVHLVSHHFPERDYQHDFNPGGYVRWDNGVTVGGYRNTLGRTSLYAGYTAEYGPLALTAGVTSGYKIKDGYGVSEHTLTPMVVPSIRLFTLGGISPRLSVIPRVGTMSTVLHLSLETTL